MTPALANTSRAFRRLELRARMFREVRDFFFERDVLEVDTPTISKAASIDPFIDLLQTSCGHYLHSSPEYAMKQLLCQDSGDIYYLGHVFRKEEEGAQHRTEFSMLEWYRTNTCQTAFLREVHDLLSLFLGDLPMRIIPYEEAFSRYTSLPLASSSKELQTLVTRETAGWSRQDLLQWIWAFHIEPKFPQDALTVIVDFPPGEAALAQITQRDGKQVAERFEIFFGQVELGNGYHELSDPIEQRERLNEANSARKAAGKEAYPLDEEFLSALNIGLPPNTYGIAVGISLSKD